jgi:hypothetical protein
MFVLCDLYGFPSDEIKDLVGVYIIFLPSPIGKVLRVGTGKIAEKLEVERSRRDVFNRQAKERTAS